GFRSDFSEGSGASGKHGDNVARGGIAVSEATRRGSHAVLDRATRTGERKGGGPQPLISLIFIQSPACTNKHVRPERLSDKEVARQLAHIVFGNGGESLARISPPDQ